MESRIDYYIDAPSGRRIFRRVEEVARALLGQGGIIGVQISGARNYDRELTAGELRRLGEAIREARAERIDKDNARMAARLGLATQAA